MNVQSASIVFGALLCTVVGQLLFRGAALTANEAGSFFNTRSMTGFGVAIAFYGVMTFLWAYALRQMSLAQAYPFMALSFLLVPVAEHYLFGQNLGWQPLVGGAVIIAGVLITQI
jgi:multidrug transporter EmrE-like cation transporter